MSRIAGRDSRKESAWRRRLERHAESGQSVRSWCRRHRVTETAFYWWRRELVRRDAEQAGSAQRGAESPAASFVPVHVTTEPARGGDLLDRDLNGGGAPIEIVLADGRCVRLAGPVNGQTLAEVLDVLERRAC